MNMILYTDSKEKENLNYISALGTDKPGNRLMQSKKECLKEMQSVT